MTIDTPIGKLYINHQNGTLKEISTTPLDEYSPDHPEIARQLGAYFQGRLKEFTLPLQPEGTSFQKSVWKILEQIPWGETLTYAEVAARLEKPGAARAIGQAVGKNPLLIVVPCHRVVAANGLGGFSSGVEVKIQLLRIEGSAVGVM